jgi:hypothetical protein
MAAVRPADRPIPTQAEVDDWLTRQGNWGCRGKDD